MDKRKTRKYEQITREVRQKRKAEESLIESTPGATELMEQASLKEAAAVFTIEGIQTFMDVFDKTINKKLTEALSTKLEQAVERIIERKMIDIIEGATDGLNRYISMMTEPQPVHHMQQVAITSNIEEKVTPYKKTAKAPAKAERLALGLTDIRKHEHTLANILAQQNGVFSPSSIMVAFTEQTGKYWSHATKVLQFMIQLGYNIRKVGRAQYVYNMSQGENSKGGN